MKTAQVFNDWQFFAFKYPELHKTSLEPSRLKLVKENKCAGRESFKNYREIFVFSTRKISRSSLCDQLVLTCNPVVSLLILFHKPAANKESEDSDTGRLSVSLPRRQTPGTKLSTTDAGIRIHQRKSCLLTLPGAGQ